MAAVVTRWYYQAVGSLVDGGSPSLPAYIGWGFNPNGLSSSDTDISLFNEAPETRTLAVVTVDTINSPNDTLVFSGTLTSAAGGTIQEVGIYDAATKPFTGTIQAGSSIIGSSSAVGLTIASGYTGSIPANDDYLQLDTGEVVAISAGGGTTSLTVSRGANGSNNSPAAVAGTNVTGGVAPGGSVFAGGQLWYHADFTYTLGAGQGLTFNLRIKLA
jgi:hypothetical protein